MEIDEGSLRSMVAVIDACIKTMRDRILWQSIATSLLGEKADEVFQKTQDLAEMKKEVGIQLADIQQTRNQFALMLEKALKGEPVQSPTDRIN
jgi:ATP-dependent exoDNAse (exonuclease V) beta subunit